MNNTQYEAVVDYFKEYLAMDDDDAREKADAIDLIILENAGRLDE